jgi:murein DD-endopeptidase MepM/ murein hydrolase activator NlpD
MKFINKKSSTGLLLFPTLGFIAAIIIFFVVSAPKIDDYIGGKQAGVLKAVGQGEQILSSVDVAARFAAWDSMFELGYNGGFHADQLGDTVPEPEKYPCDKYVYNLWNAQDEKCWPNPAVSYSKYFDRIFKYNYLAKINDALLSVSYKYTIGVTPTKKLKFIGTTQDTIPLEISYTYTKKGETPVVKEVASDKDKAFVSSDYGFLSWPVEQKSHLVTSGFGERNLDQAHASQVHAAIDIGAPFGTPVLAAANGVAKYLPGGVTDCWGALIIQHNDGLSTFYLHMNSVDVDDGAQVQRGQRIGTVGTKGQVNGDGKCSEAAYPDAHLHFGVMFDKAPQGLKYDNQNIVLDSFGMKTFVQPLCFFDPNGGYQKATDSVNLMNPLNSNLGVVCKLYGFPDTFLKTREDTTAQSIPATAAGNQIELTNTEADKKAGLQFVSKADYDRVMSYGALIKNAAGEFDIPEAKIAATIYHESRGYSDAVSGRETKCQSAVGIGQFRSMTANDFSSIFGPGVNECCCGGGSYVSSAPIGCTAENLGHNCASTDPRFDPEKSIRGIAAYHRRLMTYFEKYDDNDAFDFMAYFQGEGTIQKSIANYYKISGNDNPPWREVVKNLVDVKGVAMSSTVKEDVMKYVDSCLKAMSDFGGGSYSSLSYLNNQITPTSQVSTKSELRKLGYYHINPSFSTVVNYDLSVYDSIRAWADHAYNACKTQKDMTECVNKQTKVLNALFERSKSTNYQMPDDVAQLVTPDLEQIDPLFRFVSTYECDGLELSDFYSFIETYEDCSEFGNEKCYCEIPSYRSFGSNSLILSSTGISLYNPITDGTIRYDFPPNKPIVLNEVGDVVDSFTITKVKPDISTPYYVSYFKDNLQSTPTPVQKLYFVKKGNTLARVDDVTGLSECDVSAKHKFRFCASTDAPIPYYDTSSKTSSSVLKFKNVTIRFALDFKKLIPPPITADSEEIADTPLPRANQLQDLIQAPEQNKCQGFGNAEITIKPTTPELKSTFDGFVSNFLTDLLPSIGPLGAIFSFMQDGLATKQSLPAVMNIQIDLKGASRDCDIKGIVYKCGVGSIPYKHDDSGNALLDIGGNRLFDFSNPTGFIDLSSRFDSKSGPLPVQPSSTSTAASCMSIKNPSGSSTNGQYILPQVDGDLVSFSVDRCAEPILQFKKLDGVDILTSLMDSGVGYYFAFAYVNSAGDYGKAKVIGEDTGIKIPSVFEKLLAENGLGDMSLFGNMINGDTGSIMNALGVGDMYARALSWTSQQRYMNYASGNLFSNFVNQVSNNLPINDKTKMLAYAVRTGRIDESQATRMMGDVTQGMDYGKAENFINQLQATDNLCSAYNSYSDQLPIERKRELLGTAYSEEELQAMTEVDMDSTLREQICTPGSGLNFIQNMYPGEQVLMVNNYLNTQPSQGLQMAVNALSGDEQAQVVSNFLNTASDADRGLVSSMLSLSSPQGLMAGFNFLSSQSGFENYGSSWAEFFQDFPCDACQTASNTLTNP